MALTFPYPLAFFSDVLRYETLIPVLRRFDETSGSGDGRIWTQEMARPLWTASIAMSSVQLPFAQEIEAKIDGLDGSAKTFLFADQTYDGPASGVTAGLASVGVGTIRADRGAISLTGLPVGFTLTAKDRFSIAHSSGRVYFGRFLESGTANGAGEIAQREIRPYLPFGVATGASVELVKPYFKAIIEPGGWTPYTCELGEIARGASLRLIQKP